jgi:hypothetical protein
MALSLPVQTEDLRTFLGLPSIDSDRATILIDAAQQLCETIVSPLPDAAAVVVLVMAARAYPNPMQLAESSIGTAHMTFPAAPGGGPISGLYLARSDKANLRRLAGSSSAFAVSMMPVGANCVQALAFTGTGTFTLGLAGAYTVPIGPAAAAGDIAAALTALPTIGAGNVAVAGAAGAFALTFINDLGTTDVPALTVDATGWDGTVTCAITTRGVPAPGQNLPAWDKDYYRGSRVLGAQVYGGPWS